ncbi:MAG TPA: TRAP transporter small permease [Acetobacteraceae bacterium]|nr:TRAP transporter small permease [Acetobacteraceae bacterium]
MFSAFGGLARFAAGLTRWSIALSGALMVGLITYQVVLRYVFGATPSWSEELAVLFFSWSVLGGLALGVYEGWHVRLTLLPDALPLSVRRWTERATDAVIGALGVFLIDSGLRFYDITSGSVSAAIGYPIEILNAMAPVAGALIALFGFERALRPGGALPASETRVA